MGVKRVVRLGDRQVVCKLYSGIKIPRVWRAGDTLSPIQPLRLRSAHKATRPPKYIIGNRPIKDHNASLETLLYIL